MEEIKFQTYPGAYNDILQATLASNFTMASDAATCTLLRTLAASKPKSKLLELGTGTGLSSCWILDGMDKDSGLISIDNDPQYIEIAKKYLDKDSRIHLVCTDGGEWINANRYQKFDFVFADTWHGKYLLLDEVINMLADGGLYIIDDMLPQPNWPQGHYKKASDLIDKLESRNDLIITKLNWSTGIIIAVKLPGG